MENYKTIGDKIFADYVTLLITDVLGETPAILVFGKVGSTFFINTCMEGGGTHLFIYENVSLKLIG